MRLDHALHQRGLAPSRSAAARLITAGEVSVNGAAITKPAHKVTETDLVEIATDSAHTQWVSRAGHKLSGALERFPEVRVRDAVCLDAGASTGGFTDVLLHHGAQTVIAVDVGHDQLVPQLREHPQVQVHEGLNLRYLTPDQIGTDQVELVVADLSFISLRLVLEPLMGVCRPSEAGGADVVLMIKPQFEVGREALPKTGVVTDPQARRAAVIGVIDHAVTCGIAPCGLGVSTLPGKDGNREYFFWGRRGTPTGQNGAASDVAEWVDAQGLTFTDAEA